ncbi:alpha/beta hydrolase [Paenibacillus doosanensis]|uniref:Acetyl esterase n=1 Tax=Paenibacillus konkukensis TaxID=2020716 RepID=A0ABY4RZ22_9BACL|nr:MULTISPECIES: alpha/beta hydrolase [Paenibacillus]MCS7464326.1 alpha/beta hydrolase [Paenibacillus doosanensis]UQZ87567.1 acetyl esterase [Paenibacillus konkukensis]
MRRAVSNWFDPVSYRIEKGVSYLGPDRKEQMDVYLPQYPGNETFPCIIVVHGGGWAAGRRSGLKDLQIAVNLVACGYVVMIIDCAVARHSVERWNHDLLIPGWPNNLYDCKTAVRFAKKQAEAYHIDPERIGIIGGASGGHLALFAAFTANHRGLLGEGLYAEYSSSIQCAVNLYGIPDVLTWGSKSFSGVPLAPASQDPAWRAAAKLEATRHKSKDVPPMFIVHGEQDEEIQFRLSDEFVNQLKELNTVSQYAVEGARQRLPSRAAPAIDLRPLIIRFLDAYLK